MDQVINTIALLERGGNRIRIVNVKADPVFLGVFLPSGFWATTRAENLVTGRGQLGVKIAADETRRTRQ